MIHGSKIDHPHTCTHTHARANITDYKIHGSRFSVPYYTELKTQTDRRTDTVIETWEYQRFIKLASLFISIGDLLLLWCLQFIVWVTNNTLFILSPLNIECVTYLHRTSPVIKNWMIRYYKYGWWIIRAMNVVYSLA